MDEGTQKALAQAAEKARANAYAPYSVYNVGAAALASTGEIVGGCNVENASYGLTVCAERNAIAAMVAGGSKGLAGIAVATKDGAGPCGACLQVMTELAVSRDIPILLVDEDGNVEETTLERLMPSPFTGRNLNK